MALNEGLEVWRSILGNSDDDSDTPFEGFLLEEVKGDESDIDLGVVIRQQDLREDFSGISSVSPVSSSDSSGSATDLPAATGPKKRCRKTKKRLTKKQRDETTVRWSDKLSTVKEETVFEGFTHEGKVGVSHDLPVDATPFDYFSLLIPDKFWSDVAEQTNLYATQKQQEKGVDKYWKETTPEEIKIFIFVQFMFGIHHLPETSMYWSSDPLLRVAAIADVISKNRYEKLSQYFHLNDNSKAAAKGDAEYDPLFKVRTLLEQVRTSSHAHYHPGKHISIDEAMVKFNGRLSFKQYIKGKPNPWGIKVWCVADPRTGYMLDFDPYLGKVHEPMPYGLGHHVILRMSSRFLDKGHHLYFDNYFSSVQLAEDLQRRETYMCSTIRINRKNWPTDLSGAVAKKMKSGDILFRQCGNMVATLWKDKRPVAVLSTNSQPKMVKEQRKAPGGKKEIKIPAPVGNYNGNMGGVDLGDQLSSYYPVGRPSVRWWRYLCWWLLQTAMINAFLIWKATNKPVQRSRKGTRHIDFRLEVLRTLCQGNAVRKHDARQSVSQAGVCATEPASHISQHMCALRKKNCYWCEKQKIRTSKNYSIQTVFGCMTCNVNLCKGLCFQKFHLELASGSK
ncbi:piggyBac transposable element-derived protein 4-like [Littorina saxatilis]|uniref:PiggyBac transposable element-derived protein domain-containing protein n=1 Tax=Littorina saxatilis TaxID=31220 RepID=A0AAN9BJ67_9CAEN